MKQRIQRFNKLPWTFSGIVLLVTLAACTSSTYSVPAPVPVATTVVPTIKITTPIADSTITGSDVKVSVQIANINLVDKKGQTNIDGEGHIHYFIDVDPPTAPDKPAVTAAGTYAASSDSSYTWPNVGPGTHTLSVELVNNNHTPLSSPVIATVKITVSAASVTTPATPSPGGSAVTINISSQSMSFDKNTLTVPAGANVTLVFTNKEAIPHNVAIYKTQAATDVIFRGEIISSKMVNYQFIAPTIPGTYFFRCDVHATAMTGSFIVTGGSSGGSY